MTVHGEREVIPSATRTDAGGALKAFVTAYNKADKAYDPALDANRVTGALSAINQSGLKAKHANNPRGNPDHTDLELTNPHYTIPKMAGWPKFFVVEADTDRDRDDDPRLDNSWLLVFTRGGSHQPWQASYLTVLSPADLPRFAVGEDGLAEPVRGGEPGLAVAPEQLSSAYTTYLDKGGEKFAPGAQTSGWREQREKNATRPGLSTQYIDEPVTDGAYAPVGLRTEDGGALVFFTSRHFEKTTAAKGVNLNVSPDVKALTTGDVKQSITLERISNQVVLDPPRTARNARVRILSRIQGLTGAKGE
ncbi:hypothetical protein [Streptomyces sulfonofaciens]|uniref:hypothetical protein n=1 Tax=Streptomyces sulfonofaciens TaxID=68272 RepID=UPI0027E46413|nr:hypothetical protein [Streptomyces sulfonofaciens]